MSNDSVAVNVSIVQRLRRIRSAIERQWANRHDPRSIFGLVETEMNATAGEISLVRDFAPGVGEMWDTMAALWGMCADLYDLCDPSEVEGSRERVLPAVSAVDSEPDLHGGVAGGGGVVSLPD